jgi:hypothetical protein
MQYITNSPINHNGKLLSSNVIFTPATYKFTDIDIEYLLSNGKIKKFVPSDNTIISKDPLEIKKEIEEKEKETEIEIEKENIKRKRNKRKGNNFKVNLG